MRSEKSLPSLDWSQPVGLHVQHLTPGAGCVGGFLEADAGFRPLGQVFYIKGFSWDGSGKDCFNKNINVLRRGIGGGGGF